MRFGLTLLAFFLATVCGLRAFDIPLNSYNLAQLPNAQTKAAGKPKLIAFVISQKNLKET